MAWAILKGLHAPSLVSRAEIDAAGKKVAATEACRIKHLKIAGGVVSFDRLDDALPMPGSDPPAEPALKIAPILDDLDRYELQVSGLSPGTYELSIDGQPVGKATAEELGHGWNIATTAGPITKQGQELLQLVFKKNNTYYDRWRKVELSSLPEWAEKARVAEMARLDGKIAEEEAKINELRKPKTHHFELKAAANWTALLFRESPGLTKRLPRMQADCD